MDVLADEGASTGSVSQSGIAVSPEAHQTLAGDVGHARPRPTTIDLESYLADVTAGQPCGPDLQYDADYVELARVMQGTPEVEYGGMHIDAADPDWKTAKTLALDLLGRTRDLNLAVWLTRILLGLHGFAGLDDGLALIEGWMERNWDAVHPVLDPDDDNDPTERLNILASLADDSLLRQVKLCALVQTETQGAVCLRDIDIATGELKPAADDEPKKPEAISAAFHDVDLSRLASLADMLETACDRLRRIDLMVGEHVLHAGAGVERLSRLLRHAAKVVRDQLETHPAQALLLDVPAEMADVGEEQVEAEEAGTPRDTIESRDDVVRQIDRICDYYAAAEPGSPVPVLLQRARRLVHMNFVELMSELSPQGLAEISFLLGVRNQESTPAGADVPEVYSTFNGDISG